MSTYHTKRICESCLDAYSQLHELNRLRANVRARRARNARNMRLSREERFATWDMLDNTLSDLNITARDLRRKHTAHMEGN